MGEVINKYGVAKHFKIQITLDSFSYQRNSESINKEATLDGLYVVRSSVPKETLNAEDTVKAYKPGFLTTITQRLIQPGLTVE
ncbi:MAG: hypothetical protein RID53_27745 [Coleofasciculus sp. B1-GNL1-01]